MKPLFEEAVTGIANDQEGRVEKYLLGFTLAHIMLLIILEAISKVPLKTCNLGKIEHFCILP